MIRSVAAVVALASASLACAAPSQEVGSAGSTMPIAHWEIQSTAKAQESGAKVSSAGFSTHGWYPVSGRATVMAGLLENGKYENVFYGDNMRAVEEPEASGTMFIIPWWYRTEFSVGEAAPGTRTLLRINGMIPSADVWLNGQSVAERSTVAGAYPVHELDVTRWVHAGTNTLVLRVHPGDPRTSLSIGWVDWNPTPPDNNMGPWRGVDIVRTGPVEIRFPQVTSTLSLPDLPAGDSLADRSVVARAALTVKVEARNLDAAAHDATIKGVVAGQCRFPPRAIRLSTSAVRRSGGRSAWASIRSTAWR
jgi:exo-1,4-beta-D-glucosaminidase